MKNLGTFLAKVALSVGVGTAISMMVGDCDTFTVFMLSLAVFGWKYASIIPVVITPNIMILGISLAARVMLSVLCGGIAFIIDFVKVILGFVVGEKVEIEE